MSSPVITRKLKAKLYCLLFLSLLLFEFNTMKKDKKSNTHSPKYELINGWLQFPKDFHMGQVAGVSVDKNQNIVFFQRTGRKWTGPFPDSLISSNTIFIVDKETGKVLNSWGANLFIMPHGLTVDNDNNIWVTDVALQQVFKFNHEGQLLMKLGVAKTPGDDSAHFNLPTDVAVARDGSFYVSDGYENSRIVKFSNEGNYLFDWGKRGTGPGEFNIPHSISLDSHGNVYVADRENNRIQKFDGNGKFLKEWKNDEATSLFALSVSQADNIFAVDDLYVNDSLPMGDDVLQFDVNLDLQMRFGRNDSSIDGYSLYHDIAVDNKENIYVADVARSRVEKFKKMPDN